MSASKLTRHERVISESWFLSFSLWTENLTFQRYCKFSLPLKKCCTCLIVWRDSVWRVKLDLVYTIVLIGRFAWFDESLENWNFDQIKYKIFACAWPCACIWISMVYIWAFSSGFTNFSRDLSVSTPRVVYYAGKSIEKYVLLLKCTLCEQFKNWMNNKQFWRTSYAIWLWRTAKNYNISNNNKHDKSLNWNGQYMICKRA